MRLTDHRGRRRDRANGRRPAHRRQHLRVAVLPASARARRRHRLPLDDQVLERAQRHDRRLRRRARRRSRRASCSSSTTRPAPWPARSTPGSPSAAPRRCTSACDSTTPTAVEIAKWLVEQVGSENVSTTSGFRRHPQHELAKRQMSGFGGMISIELGTRERAAHVLGRVKVFSLAESLGGVESLISQPAWMTHASVPPEMRAKLGITEGLVRLSCGVEDVEDLLADLEPAFEEMPRAKGAQVARAGRGRLTRDTCAPLVRRRALVLSARPPSPSPLAPHLPCLASSSRRSPRAPGSIPPIAPRSTRSAPFPASTKSCARSPASSASAAFASSSSATRCR